MRKNVSILSATLLVVFAFALLALPALAGGPPMISVSIPTGNISPWGQAEIEWASLVIDTPPYSTDQLYAGAYNTGEYTYVAMEKYSNVGVPYQTVVSPDLTDLYYNSIRVYVWSGPNETRTNVPITFAGYGPYRYEIWSDETGLLDSAFLSNGQQYTLDIPTMKVSNLSQWQEAHAFTIAVTPVPEPGSMLAMLSGLAGLAGYGLWRRKS